MIYWKISGFRRPKLGARSSAFSGIEMEARMNTAANSNMPARRGLACGLQSTGMMRVATWVENALLRRRTRLQLAELGDDGLKDIGLTRDHVEADLGNYFSA
jgi:uncharacterized protein YjiS (DUF1127 family)